MSFEIRDGQITANSDFNGPERKATAVFMMELFTPGGTAPADTDPRLHQAVTTELAPDVDPARVEQIAQSVGFIVRYS